MNPSTPKPGALSREFHFMIRSVLLPALVLSLTNQSTRADSATWTGRDPSLPYIWEEEGNWSPNTVPDAPEDVATFGVAGNTLIFVGAFSGGIDPGTMIFNLGASQYTFEMQYSGLTLTNDGIVNNSGVTQTFNVGVGSSLSFQGIASAGSGTVFTAEPSGSLYFENRSTAGEATCIASGGNGDGTIYFFQRANADHATLIANPGMFPGFIALTDRSQGGFARVILLGDDAGNTPGQLTIAARYADRPDVTIGSLEGVGNVTLAQQYDEFAGNLIVGSNNLSTTFGGVIWYGYYFRDDGSLTKVGTGTLTLTGANLHRGGTIVKRGKLLVNNTTGSGTGEGPVSVEGGTLGGTGIIADAVTIGDGTARQASLAPGRRNSSEPLTIQSTLLLNSNATLRIRINSNNTSAGAVVANGVTINAAQFFIGDAGNTTLPAGTTFTVIDNTATTLISGTFSNLADGGTITVGSNAFQASYEGGDGNDLTLTVVP